MTFPYLELKLSNADSSFSEDRIDRSLVTVSEIFLEGKENIRNYWKFMAIVNNNIVAFDHWSVMCICIILYMQVCVVLMH